MELSPPVTVEALFEAVMLCYMLGLVRLG